MSTALDQISAATHEHWMAIAIKQAEQAAALDEVPIGAVVVDILSQQIIGAGFNQPIRSSDPTAHAEILALRSAAKTRENYRLPGTVLYVTIEPCTMCVGALIHARVDLLVFGAREPRAGAVVSQLALPTEEHFNHRLAHLEGVLEESCSALMTEFFQTRRVNKAGSI